MIKILSRENFQIILGMEKNSSVYDFATLFLRGRDIKRYSYDWANLWIIYIPWHFLLHLDETIQGASEKAEVAFKEQYPSAYEHMLSYKEPLSKRNKSETGIRYEWYALQRWGAKYWEDFLNQKLCIKN